MEGTITGGTVSPIPDSGEITLGVPSPGTISSVGEMDEWMFFGRASRWVTVVVNPDSGSPSPPLSPYLGNVEVQLFDRYDHVLATASSTADEAVVTLSNVPLPIDGVYRVRIQAPGDHPSDTGNYVLTVWDSTPDVAPLVLNQQVTGQIRRHIALTSGHSLRWPVSKSAFNLVDTSSSGIVFDLAGPGGWIGFSDLANDSDQITLPSSGTYTLTARGTGGNYNLTYACLVEIPQTDLVLGTTYNGTLAGSGQAQLFRVDVPAGEFLHVTLDDSTSADSNEVYIKFGLPPTRADFDYRYSAVGSANQDVWALNSNPGTWYILVYGASVPAPSNYTLLATASRCCRDQLQPEPYWHHHQ